MHIKAVLHLTLNTKWLPQIAHFNIFVLAHKNANEPATSLLNPGVGTDVGCVRVSELLTLDKNRLYIRLSKISPSEEVEIPKQMLMKLGAVVISILTLDLSSSRIMEIIRKFAA